MKFRTTIPLLATLGLATGCASLAQGPPSVSGSTAYSTAYWFRGTPINTRGVYQGDVSASIPTSEVSSLGLTTWYNIDASDSTGDAIAPDENRNNVTEVDMLVEYSHSFDAVDTNFGFVNYSFPNTGGSTTEIYGSASMELGPIAPFASLYYDIDNVGGIYLNTGVAYGLTITEELALTLSSMLGWMSSDQAETYFGDDTSGLSDFSANASVDYTLDEATTLFGGVSFVVVPESSLRDALDDAGLDESGFWVNFGVGWSF